MSAPRSALEDPPLPTVLLVGAYDAPEEDLAGLFSGEGYAPCRAASSVEARRLTAEQDFDLIVLDGQMPAGGAMGLCRWLAASPGAPPIIVLSNSGDVTDRVLALEMGADDLIGRPFDPRELLARARALRRRSARPGTGAPAPTGALQPMTRMLTGPEGVRVPVPERLFSLLYLLVSRAGQLVTFEMLDAESGLPEPLEGANLRTTIVRLRDRLEAAGFDPNILVTVRGGGYSLEEGHISLLAPGGRRGAGARDSQAFAS